MKKDKNKHACIFYFTHKGEACELHFESAEHLRNYASIFCDKKGSYKSKAIAIESILAYKESQGFKFLRMENV